MRQALAEQLGIDRRELGFAVTRLPWDGEPLWTVALYDAAPGGAGYAPRAADDVGRLLGRAQRILECPAHQCDRMCHGCLLGFDTDRQAHLLDRHAALGFVTACLNGWG